LVKIREWIVTYDTGKALLASVREAE